MKYGSPSIVILVLLLTFAATQSYGQNTKEARSVFEQISVKEQITILFDGSNYAINALSQLRQDLLMYEHKISAVILDNNTKQLSITYNGFMQRYDFENAFTKNGISFYRTPTANKNAVLSVTD